MQGFENGNYKISMEGRMSRVETTLEEIKTNHLPHIQAKVDKMMWLLVTSLAAALIELIKVFYG